MLIDEYHTELEKLKKELSHIREAGTLDGEDADRKENMHRLFMYPAMMVPATQSAIIKVLSDILHIKNAIDPFVGSGTSLLSCMEFGINVFGQDINPFAVLLSKAKTTDYDISILNRSFEQIQNHIKTDGEEIVDINFKGIDKWFTEQSQIDFSKIRRAIIAQDNQNIRLFFWVLMSEAIRIGSNDRTSTFKLHKRSEDDLSHRNINVIKEFIQIANRGISDYSLFKQKLQDSYNAVNINFRGQKTIVWGNTKNKIECENKFDLLVSSPPYGDNHTTVTYGQTSYLPLQWIDPKDIFCPYDYLKTTQEIDRQSLGGITEKIKISIQKEQIFQHSPSLLHFLKNIPEEDIHKYDKTISFISDFDESLDTIIKVMNENAFYIWTIGNRFVGGREVPNDKILQDLMEFHGLKLFFRAERKILNKKQPRKNNFSTTMEKELILIFNRG